MVTQLDIINLAFDKLGATPLASVDENTPHGDMARRNWDNVRQRLLEEYPWNFATLIQAVEPTIINDKNYYLLPDNCLRVLRVNNFEHFRVINVMDGTTREKAIILADCAYGGGSMMIEYIEDVQTPGHFPPFFIEYFACVLAIGFALKITESASRAQIMQALAQDAERKAKNIDAEQSNNGHEEIELADGWIDKRFYNV